MAGDGVAGTDQADFNTGYRIRARSHGSGPRMFVWTPGGGAQSWTQRTVATFKSFDRQPFDKGLRLIHLSPGFWF